MKVFDPVEYKMSSKTNWNAMAGEYHRNWADGSIGPFMSTAEVVRLAEINPSDRVLDLACGTGALSRQVIPHLGDDGRVYGVDFSRTALSIARKFVNSHKANFFEMDAENIGFAFSFDKVICQYGLMFFPDVGRVLKDAKNLLKNEGRIVLAVHGTAEEVPYFSSIMKPILEHVPEIRPKGSPNVHRFGNPPDLEKEIISAGFSDLTIKKHLFSFEVGTFDDYWYDYMHSTASSIRHTIESLGEKTLSSIKQKSEENIAPYLRGNTIVFPWTVIIASGRKPRFD